MARAAPVPSRPRHRPNAEGLPPKKGDGRGAKSNASGRYEKLTREETEDGWDIEEEAPPLKTDVTLETPRRIINYVDSPFVPFDRSINPIRGCEHGCIYCFARPTHAYYGLSAGIDFESKLFAKPNAASLLRRELASKTYKPNHIAIGTNTDPYQPAEKRLQIMRGIVSVLREFRHPVSILTKSALITRDIDHLAAMAEMRLVTTMLSLTTLDRRLARAMEPRAATPKRRLEAISTLASAGVPVGVMTAPMIPGLNDDELESLLETAKDAGARFAGYTILRLPLEVSTLFKEWLEATYPDRAQRVMRHIRDMNGGRDYDPQWSRAREPRTVYAKLMSERFAKATRRIGIDEAFPRLRLDLFQRPVEKSAQLSLFNESSSE
ncbi:MAG TPA: PA0069 family radical SAM protein [Parvularculaceae bacterium]|nr:PA0069 family radical SAM protein [Parvularculaceae bacterium]